ncbi:hypothetical protein O181_038374 [Austropuccinia psidii MF-1]|uniref:Retrovirus-related Pol polyprotein from transposon TNT 1-94-like beta-barrel domain-containing protein n=1 Tax=Austropuccinia psidii MF-1 TaxID=1389203 RepID=A0A9Q3D8C2_9BASI|nr:hypothetical protein [Austropuccinia psidii MF-1]
MQIQMKTEEIELANGSTIHSEGHGTIRLELPHMILQVKSTLYIPKLATNLLSMETLLKTNHIIKGLDNECFEVIDKNKIQIMTGSFKTGNLIIDTQKYSALSDSTVSPKDILQLHQAAGNPSIKYIRKIIPGMNIPEFECITCNTCKMTKTPFKSSFPPSSHKLEFLHLDLCGPISPPLVSGARYFLKIMDRFLHYSWIFFLQHKSEAKEIFEQHVLTTPYTPEQNPLAERGNRTTIEKTRCLLKDSGLYLTYCAESTNTAVFLENRTPKRALAFESPFVKWYKRNNNLLHIHPFGGLAICLKQKANSKFEEKGAEGIFLGYEEGPKLLG